jgi:hypothetical protein
MSKLNPWDEILTDADLQAAYVEETVKHTAARMRMREIKAEMTRRRNETERGSDLSSRR